MEPGGGALLKRSIICDSPRAPCILVRGRERRKKKEVRIDRNGGPVGEEKKGKVCKADCELARVGGILAPFHLMREGPRACSIELMMEGDLLRITKSS